MSKRQQMTVPQGMTKEQAMKELQPKEGPRKTMVSMASPATPKPSSTFQVPKRQEAYRQTVTVEMVTMTGSDPVPHTTKTIQFWIETADKKKLLAATHNGSPRNEDIPNGTAFWPRGMIEPNLFEALARAPRKHPILDKPAEPKPEG